MGNNLYGVLIDLVSIQKFVFSSNELKDNLGASFLVEEIYNDFLSEAYSKVTGKSLDVKNWNSSDFKLGDFIGYIGGGNALLFLDNEDDTKKFIKQFTKILLIKAPSCIPITAYDLFDLNNFNQSKENLFKRLRLNKASYLSQTSIPRHGITTECSKTGLSSECLEYKGDKRNYISMASKVKIDYASDAKYNHNQYITNNDYIFTDDLSKLGQEHHDKNYISVVHIDGNSIGDEFKKAKDINHLRKLSKEIKEITENSFKDLISLIISQKEELKLGENINEEKNKIILPIRPIIIGGDDITFVCAGKFGIYFAKLYLEFFEKHSKLHNYNFTACAGVSIVKTKYPFYKAYEISEQACSNAKEHRNTKADKKGSWIDFNISSGTILSNLQYTRETQFKNKDNSLLFRPYIINNDKYPKSFNKFVQNTTILKNEFPNSKIKELREVLTLGEDSILTFIEQQKTQGHDITKIKIDGKNYSNDLFQDNINPYFDLIELIEFYPSFLLEEGEKNNE